MADEILLWEGTTAEYMEEQEDEDFAGYFMDGIYGAMRDDLPAGRYKIIIVEKGEEDADVSG